MLKIKQIEKEDLNLKNLIELSTKFDVYCLSFSVYENIIGKKIKELRLTEIECRIRHPESYVFIYIEKEEE